MLLGNISQYVAVGVEFENVFGKMITFPYGGGRTKNNVPVGNIWMNFGGGGGGDGKQDMTSLVGLFRGHWEPHRIAVVVVQDRLQVVLPSAGQEVICLAKFQGVALARCKNEDTTDNFLHAVEKDIVAWCRNRKTEQRVVHVKRGGYVVVVVLLVASVL